MMTRAPHTRSLATRSPEPPPSPPTKMWMPPGPRRPEVGPSQPAQLVELAVFLLLILPSLILSLFTRPEELGAASVDFASLAVGIIVRDIALVALVVFFVWRSGEARGEVPFAKLGWDVREAPREIVLGIILFFPMTISAAFIAALLQALGFSGPGRGASALSPPAGIEILLALLLVIVVAIAEETIFRGYLMLRIRNVTGSVPLAIVASSLVFAIGHGYQGVSGLVAVGVIGVELALVYVWRGSLVAPMTMHFLQDFIGIVLLPFLGMID